MNQSLRVEAERLAKRHYTEIIIREVTTDGVPAYFAYIVELPNCNAQGMTADEASAELQEAKIDYIESLLIDHLPIPTPNVLIAQSLTPSLSTVVIDAAPVPALI